MTISEIIKKTKVKMPFFFSRKTLSAFGQTLSSFTVVNSKSKRVFIYAPMKDSRGVKMGFDIREYKSGDLLNVKIPISVNTSAKIKSYLLKK